MPRRSYLKNPRRLRNAHIRLFTHPSEISLRANSKSCVDKESVILLYHNSTPSFESCYSYISTPRRSKTSRAIGSIRDVFKPKRSLLTPPQLPKRRPIKLASRYIARKRKIKDRERRRKLNQTLTFTLQRANPKLAQEVVNRLTASHSMDLIRKPMDSTMLSRDSSKVYGAPTPEILKTLDRFKETWYTRIRTCCSKQIYTEEYLAMGRGVSRATRRLLFGIDHSTCVFPDDPLILPFTTIMEEVVVLLNGFNNSLQTAIDVLSVPFSMVNESLNRLKAAVFFISKAMIIIDPEKCLGKTSFLLSLRPALSKFVKECARYVHSSLYAMGPMCEVQKLLDRRKGPLKAMESRLKLLLYDEEDQTEFIPHKTSMDDYPKFNMRWVPVGKTPISREVCAIFIENSDNYIDHIEPDALDLIWLPSDECFFRDCKQKKWYQFTALNHGFRLDIFEEMLASIIKMMRISSLYVGQAIREANKLQEGYDTNDTYLIELLEQAGIEAKRFRKVNTGMVSNLRLFTLQRTTRSFFKHAAEFRRKVNFFMKAMNWLENTLPAALKLSMLKKKQWKQKLKLTDPCLSFRKRSFLQNDFQYVRLRVPINLDFQSVLFPLTVNLPEKTKYLIDYLVKQNPRDFNNRLYFRCCT